MKRLLIVLLAWFLLFSSFRKDKNSDHNPPVMGTIAVEFDNIAGTADLQLNTGSYTNAGGQTFTVTKLKYFVSNFKLTDINGKVYTVPQDECYFLIDESLSASQRHLLQVPEGEYKSLSFMLGVDSLRNTMDINRRTGDLDISEAAADMYWSWNSGYIFFKMEGTSPAASHFMYHIGGYGGYKAPTTNNLKTITLDLTAKGIAKVKNGKTSRILVQADLLKVFSGPESLTLGSPAEIQSPKGGIPVANNYATMFRHSATENK
jgi:hypothetical protein